MDIMKFSSANLKKSSNKDIQFEDELEVEEVNRFVYKEGEVNVANSTFYIKVRSNETKEPSLNIAHEC